MEPLKPEVRERILGLRPEADADIEEYERLLSARFAVDPDQPSPEPEALTDTKKLEDRLTELYKKLFGEDQNYQ